ncbi:hypothetical protein H8356DRAFT_1417052 [Neocallimastix lanati (nom. inval.)]|nr:hypothetical protein H8356DRAFT_1417052 [Neocallimastix sp. JGI-2020a]
MLFFKNDHQIDYVISKEEQDENIKKKKKKPIFIFGLKIIKNKKIAISKLALDIPLNHPVNDVYKGTFDESEVLGYLPDKKFGSTKDIINYITKQIGKFKSNLPIDKLQEKHKYYYRKYELKPNWQEYPNEVVKNYHNKAAGIHLVFGKTVKEFIEKREPNYRLRNTVNPYIENKNNKDWIRSKRINRPKTLVWFGKSQIGKTESLIHLAIYIKPDIYETIIKFTKKEKSYQRLENGIKHLHIWVPISHMAIQLLINCKLRRSQSSLHTARRCIPNVPTYISNDHEHQNGTINSSLVGVIIGDWKFYNHQGLCFNSKRSIRDGLMDITCGLMISQDRNLIRLFVTCIVLTDWTNMAQKWSIIEKQCKTQYIEVFTQIEMVVSLFQYIIDTSNIIGDNFIYAYSPVNQNFRYGIT